MQGNGRALAVVSIMLLLACAPAVSGCGGGGGDSGGGGGGGGGKLSTSELQKREDEACKKAASDYTDAQKTPLASNAKIVAYAHRMAAIFDKLTADLRQLTPPDDKKADWDAFVAANVKRSQALDAASRKADTDPTGAANEISKISQQVGPASPSAQAADKLGVDFICI